MRDGSLIFIIVLNRVKLMSRNRLFIVLCIMLPLLFSLMVNRIFTKSSLYDSVPIAVIDFDNSVLSKKVITDIADNPSINLQAIEEGDIEEYISKEKVQAVYVFKQGLEDSIKKGQYDEIISVYTVPGSLTAMGISDIIAGEIIPSICEYKVINTAEKLLPEVEKEKIIAGISTRMEALHLDKDFELPVLVDMRTPLKGENVDEEEDKDIFSLSIGLGLIIIFTTLFMLTGCSAIIKERENRVRSRIKAVGVTPFRLMAADLLSVAFAGVLITSLQFIMIYTVLREVSTEGILIVSVLMVIYAFAAAAVLIVFSSIFRKHVSFQSFMPIVVLIMGLLSGCIWSVEMMPSAISTMSAYMPSYWAHSGLLEVILYEGDVQSVVLNLVVLLIMGGTFFIPGYFIYKKQSGN